MVPVIFGVTKKYLCDINLAHNIHNNYLCYYNYNAQFLKPYNPHISESITRLAMILINGNLQTNNFG